MGFLRIAIAYLAAVAATYVTATFFFTQQVMAKQAEIGLVYTRDQALMTFTQNLAGLAPAYGLVLSVGLLIGFAVAALLKRMLKPLAAIAYPLAGAAAVGTAIYLIETTMAKGGAGAIGGARDALGFSLQCLAGAAGGVVFALLLPRRV